MSKPATRDPLAARRKRARAAVWAIIAIGGAVAIWGRYQQLSRTGAPATTQMPPAPPPKAAKTPTPSQPAPEVRFLLSHRAPLKLTPLQVKQMERLQALLAAESRPARDAAVEAVRSASKGATTRGTVQEIQTAAAPVSALSADLVATRRKYWAMATSLLTEEQKQNLKPLLKQVTLADLLPAPSAQTRQDAQSKETRTP